MAQAVICRPSPRRHGFDPVSLLVRFMVIRGAHCTKAAFWFASPYCCYQEKQAKNGNRPKRMFFFRNSMKIGQQSTLTFSFQRSINSVAMSPCLDRYAVWNLCAESVLGEWKANKQRISFLMNGGNKSALNKQNVLYIHYSNFTHKATFFCYVPLRLCSSRAVIGVVSTKNAQHLSHSPLSLWPEIFVTYPNLLQSPVRSHYLKARGWETKSFWENGVRKPVANFTVK